MSSVNDKYPASLYYKRPYKPGGKMRIWFKCRDCKKENMTDKSHSKDGGASRRCNSCLKKATTEQVKYDSHGTQMAPCPRCGKMFEARRLESRTESSRCSG